MNNSTQTIRFEAESVNFFKISGQPIAYWASQSLFEVFDNATKLGDISRPRVGQNTGDNNKFLRLWFEVSNTDITFNLQHDEMQRSYYKWLPYNKGGDFRRWYGNQEYLINWEFDGKEIKDYAVVRNNGKHWSRYIQNVENMCKAGITWTFISSSNFAVRFLPTGFICDVAGSAIFPDDKYMNAICAFLNSSVVYHILKILNPTINFQAGNIASLPVEKKIFENKGLAEITGNNIELSKEDWDSFETSWDFKKHPLI